MDKIWLIKICTYVQNILFVYAFWLCNSTKGHFDTMLLKPSFFTKVQMDKGVNITDLHHHFKRPLDAPIKTKYLDWFVQVLKYYISNIRK